MQLAQYQGCYDKFLQAYGNFQNWPVPHYYMSWYFSLSQQYQSLYLHPNNYCYLYEWVRQSQKNNKKQKLSRGQKRKLKKKQLQQQLDREKKLIGRWVQKQRKDLIDKLEIIENQQKKQKEKKQKRLSNLIEIHKQVYKHHMKRKINFVDNTSKKVCGKNKKKRTSMIKKMKQIFQHRRQKIMNQLHKTQGNNQNENLDSVTLKLQSLKIQQKVNEQQQFVDVSDNEEQKPAENETKVPSVSFPITQIQYTNIGKLAGKIYNEISLRQWVTNVPDTETEQIALQLINRLAYKQAIKKVNNPQKAKKIIVSGLKQSKRTLKTIIQNKKSKCIIIALNIQRNNLVKGVDDELQKCITLGQNMKIPVIHTSTRSKLGRAFTGKFGPRLSIISIINYQGYQDYMQQLIKAWQKSCQQYRRLP